MIVACRSKTPGEPVLSRQTMRLLHEKSIGMDSELSNTSMERELKYDAFLFCCCLLLRDI